MALPSRIIFMRQRVSAGRRAYDPETFPRGKRANHA